VKKSNEDRCSRGPECSLIERMLVVETCCRERFFASRSCACLLCDGARDGISGDDVTESCRSSTDEADRRGDFFELKRKIELVALEGVLDGGGDTSVSAVSRDRCEPAEQSESSAELREEAEDTEFEALRCARIIETSGAL
jgi:hypothetical protein